MTVYGHATKVGYAKSAPTTKALEFLSCTVKPYRSLIGGDGSETRLGRSRADKHVVSGLKWAAGNLTLEPRPDDLDLLLELIFGTAINTDVVTLAESLPTFVLDVAYGTVDAVRYSGGKVNTATFRSSSGGKLTLSLDLEFLDWDDTITYPSIDSSYSTKRPYAHHGSVLSLDTPGGGSAVQYTSPEWELTINNFLDTQRFENGTTRPELPETDRQVTFRGSVPFSSAVKSEFGDALLTGLVGDFSYTLGGDSLTFDMPAMQWALEGPEIPGKGQEVRLPLLFECRATASAKEIEATNVSA